MSLRLSGSLIAVLVLAGSAIAGDPACSTCKDAKQPAYIYQFCQSKYRAPYVHPDTPFGYYPTCWREWPGGATCPRPGCAVHGVVVVPGAAVDTMPIMPQVPDAEPLPAPRPAEPKK